MSAASRRVGQQPAFLLHARPFRDSSQLLDVLSADYGKVALVARGVRSSRSRLRGILRPFLPLRISWVQKSDLGTLTGAELESMPIALAGDALLSGYYVNELIMSFLHRHDPQPELFAAYRETVERLAQDGNPAPVLRSFEMELLRMTGYALDLEHEAVGAAVLEPAARYEYRPEQGAVRSPRSSGERIFTGAELQRIAAQQFDDTDVLRAAGRLLRNVIHHHLDGRELHSRKVMLALRRQRPGPPRQ